MKKYNYLIVGAGVIGLATAREILARDPSLKIAILEKEEDVAYHASGRNSGVLHAGFYYTADSLKAKFTLQGNQELKKFCNDKKIPINECGKLVVAQNALELETLKILKERGDQNKVPLIWVSEEELKNYDPLAKTFKQALWSPETATVDPVEVCRKIKEELIEKNVHFYFKRKFLSKKGNLIQTTKELFEVDYFINCAGLYADRIAKEFGFSENFTILPFKGVYLKASQKIPIQKNIYPVPNIDLPFLGVHFTVTHDGFAKVGPTAMPCLWRENYKGFDSFSLKDFFEIFSLLIQLFIKNDIGFRKHTLNEIKKYSRSFLLSLSQALVTHLPQQESFYWSKPGIRAQLMDLKTKKLVQDFIIQGDKNSLHVLNAVSPAFTCSFPFSRYIVDKLIEYKGRL